MKSKKFYKYITVLCIFIIAFIIIILINSEFTITKNKNSEAVKDQSLILNMALITGKDCSDTKIAEIIQTLDNISDELGKSYDIFDASNYNNSYEDTITAAAGSGASLIICPDASFEETVYQLQTSYINVYFIIIDGIPHNSDYSDTTINYNVIPLMYDDADIGFLAGYAATYEGYKKIGFVGLESSQTSQCFYGLLNGINYACQMLNINDVTVDYCYATDDNYEAMTGKIFADGNEIIVACGDTVIEETSKISDKQHIPCITCGDSYPFNNNYIVASSFKNVSSTLYDCIYDFYVNNATGGSSVKNSVTNGSVGLKFDSGFFKTFNSAIYNMVYQQLAENKITIISDTTISPEDLELTNIKSIRQIIEDN